MMSKTTDRIDEDNHGRDIAPDSIDIAYKLSEVIEDMNAANQRIEHLEHREKMLTAHLERKEPAKKEETTAYYSMVYTASELDRAKSEAVEAYKKRLVDRFMDLYDPYDKENTNMIVLLYQAMREADHKPSKYLTAEGMREYDGSKWV